VTPYYSDDLVTLYHGNAADVLPLIGAVDAVATDPPYGVGLGTTGDPRGGNHGLALSGYDDFADTYGQFVGDVVPQINAALNLAPRGGVFTGPHIHEQRKPDAIGGIYCPGSCARNVWGFKSFLPVLLYGTSPTVARGAGATVPTVITSSERADRDEIGHPVPKPLGWMRWLVRLASLPGETVLDPFAGSGTTGLAARLEGRRAILIERVERYCDIAARRLERMPRESASGQLTLLAGGAQ
jgi:site-specific DNA-methyltransferase (adenine-specific)